MMACSLCWLPILLNAITIVCIAIAYTISVTNEHVYPFWPYISDTGGEEPESCVFGQLLNFTAVLAMATIYVRYKLVQAFSSDNRSLNILNRIGLVLGAISCLGISIVANFQETYILAVHMTGALMAFGVGVVYCFFQAVITRKMYPEYNGRCIWITRLLLSIVGLVALLFTIIFGTVANSKLDSTLIEKGENQTTFNIKLWSADFPGYSEHVASTWSEWILVAAFLSFFITYTKEFTKISMAVETELLVSHLDETPPEPTERTGLLSD